MNVGTLAVIHGDPLLHSVLLGRRKSNGQWELPGGKPDDGEHPKEAVVREVFEECGVVLHPNDGLTVGMQPGRGRGDLWWLTIGFQFELDRQVPPILKEPDKFSEWRWFEIAALGDVDVHPLAMEFIEQGEQVSAWIGDR